ncbi:single-stranded-DNA-specific exonuclease RecJ [Candidatus Kaiserbacteria bacterium]|nr:single-stranded-DNA-specific exonuclease RecJ [Candidatus Kaiserbacteria bacterium]
MEVSPLVRSFLAKRGIESDDHIKAFLNPDYECGTHDPYLLAGMDRAVARLLSAIGGGERIAVYADFDCDGIPGAALLSDFFKKIGYENFEVYLPHRDREGYGFHADAIARLADRGVALIITVDVGTTALEAVDLAKEKGVDVIVTDHHEIPAVLPAALAILNPKIEGYPFPNLCGAAVAFKLAHATLIEGRRRKLAAFREVPLGWEKWLLDLVAIATVADMVPLVGENRVLAHWGLKVLRKSPRRGIRALVAKLRLRQAELTEDDIGFSLAPRINAASRMDEPDLALKLLTTQDTSEAHALAAKLESLNASRKGVVAGVVKEARKHVLARFSPEERVVVVGSPAWKPALLGLAANSIMSERGGVVCLWGRDANGKLKGSCRSDGDVPLPKLFADAGDIFEESGGHEKSGGFSVSHERVHMLPDVLKAAFGRIAESQALQNMEGLTFHKAAVHESDARLTLSDVSRELFADVSRLSPFGIGNPKPRFLIGSCIVTDVRRFGREKGHTEVMLECRASGISVRAFEFFKSPEDFTHVPERGSQADVVATLERDPFRGGLVLRIVDIVPAA